MDEPTFRERGLLIVADDNPDHQELLLGMVTELAPDIGVAAVADGEQLISLLRSRRDEEHVSGLRQPTVVLLDLTMPGMGGVEAIRAMKADPSLRRIPVIAFTVSDDEQDVRDMYDLRASAYIVKPGSRDGMRSVVSGIIGFWFEAVKLAQNT